MSGKEILVDTNIIIFLLQGNDTLAEMLQGKQLYISFITELELLGFHSASREYQKQIDAFIDECLIISLNNHIKQKYVALRKAHKIKLADGLVAATALSLNMPLMTADKQFKNINTLQLIHYER